MSDPNKSINERIVPLLKDFQNLIDSKRWKLKEISKEWWVSIIILQLGFVAEVEFCKNLFASSGSLLIIVSLVSAAYSQKHNALLAELQNDIREEALRAKIESEIANKNRVISESIIALNIKLLELILKQNNRAGALKKPLMDELQKIEAKNMSHITLNKESSENIGEMVNDLQDAQEAFFSHYRYVTPNVYENELLIGVIGTLIWAYGHVITEPLLGKFCEVSIG